MSARETPASWIFAPIADLLEPLANGQLLDHGWSPQCHKEPAYSEDEWGVLKTTSIQPGAFHDEHNKKLPDKLSPRPNLEVHAGDLLLTCAGPRARCGVPCLVRETRPRLILSGKMYRFRARQGLVEPRYLEDYLLSSPAQAAIDRMKTGINDSGLNLTHGRFKRLPVVLAPLPEQHRIVSAIESYFTRLDDAVATLERVQRNLKRYRASVLKAAVEGRLVPTEAELARAEGRSYEPASALLTRILAERRRRWEEAELAKMTAKGKAPKDDKWKAKYVEPVAPDTKMLGDLPDGWLWATVESIASKVVDGVHKKPSYVDEGVPFVTVKNLTAGPGISFGSLRYVTQNDHEKFIARANPERGDLLVSKDGTLGVIRAIRTDRVFSIFVSVALVKPILREISDYLEIAFSSPVMQVQMIPKGSGLQHIHLEDLRADCVPVPPLAEAERICFEVQRHISMIDELEREVSQNVTRCLRLRQSILKWAFEGRLVDQDPTDEPASVLLERIRAERASATDTTPRRARRTNPRAPKS